MPGHTGQQSADDSMMESSLARVTSRLGEAGDSELPAGRQCPASPTVTPGRPRASLSRTRMRVQMMEMSKTASEHLAEPGPAGRKL
jgi:hypothetical protein